MKEARVIGQPDPLVGTTLIDRYRVLERIGAGAMGAVYRAEQVGLDREVALKVLKKRPDAPSDIGPRFEREARAMSALTHPNTVRVYDFGTTEDGLLFLSMELLRGELASNRLTDQGGVNVPQAIDWVRQVLHSLGEAHAKGIIHRDIKPDNIFLAKGEDGQGEVVKLLDFGIAKSIEGERKLDQFETLDGTVFGTPRYMSPEQAQGRALDARSDLYAVGVVLYELLVGSPPFVDRDAVIVMAKHIREQPLPLRVAAPTRSFPPSLQRVLDKALDKAPQKRFQSAEEFEQALLPCVREAELLEHTPARGRRLAASLLAAPRWARWTTLTALALLVIATSAALALRSERRVEPGSAAPEPSGDTLAMAAPPPQTTPPPEPPAASHTVMLYSTPAGANVWRDDHFAGVTPLSLEVPAGKSARVRVSMQGYATQTLDLTTAETTRTVALERVSLASNAPAPTASKTQASSRTARARHPTRKPASTGSSGSAHEGSSTRDSYEKFTP